MPPLNRQWRSTLELEQDPSFMARAAQEFPGLAAALEAPHTRRRVLQLMGAAFAMSGLSGCDVGAPEGKLIPAVKAPPNIIPGLPDFYATAHVLDGFATGIVVEHQMGRPTEVEGNPLHPASLGATSALGQAQVLDFYDPDRAAAIAYRRRPSDRATFLTALVNERQRMAQSHGAGLHILTGTTTSPTLVAQLNALSTRYPEARWHRWDAISRDNVRKGARSAYGQPVDVIPNLSAVDVLLAIDSDLISSAPGHLRFARDLMARRNPTRGAESARIYAIEPTPSLIGAVADHRFSAGPRDLQRWTTALAGVILQGAKPAADLPDWIGKVAADLLAHHGKALVHVGPDQPAELHALAHAMNATLGAPIELIEPVAPDTASSLLDDMHEGKVGTLLILDSNPVLAAPGFAAGLERVELSIALNPFPDETFSAATWSVPMTHPWETWSDARAYDGTATILQPQALPLYDGLSAHQLLALLLTPTLDTPPDTLDLVQMTWKERLGESFAEGWREALANGVVANSAARRVSLELRTAAIQSAIGDGSPSTAPASPLTLLLRPDPFIWDGRYANNAWLQELPRPLTKLTWDNPLLISPALARSHQLQNGDEVHLSVGTAGVTTPVWILPGQAPDTLVALLGFGRHHVGAVAEGNGVDYYPLRGQVGTPTLRKTGRRLPLASTDHHNLILNVAGDLIKHGSLDAYRADPNFLRAKASHAELYRWQPEGPAAWGMSIDLNACIGCSACVVACQSENNIPTVGKEQVMHEREMHWLRIDRYWEGQPDEPQSYFQPILCMHCEQAPCETVCPVGATVHDSEGLNVMVYNRCVGTRFCSNNCPYKVRRFNYYGFAQEERSRPPQSRNPDVTVRARGVMEKCTFCLQRIAEARITADRDNRPVGTVTTACQAACPTQAIAFGNLRDTDSEIAKRKQSPLSYTLLEEQNTHPRVSYEALIDNPNPAIDSRGRRS